MFELRVAVQGVTSGPTLVVRLSKLARTVPGHSPCGGVCARAPARVSKSRGWGPADPGTERGRYASLACVDRKRGGPAHRRASLLFVDEGRSGPQERMPRRRRCLGQNRPSGVREPRRHAEAYVPSPGGELAPRRLGLNQRQDGEMREEDGAACRARTLLAAIA